MNVAIVQLELPDQRKVFYADVVAQQDIREPNDLIPVVGDIPNDLNSISPSIVNVQVGVFSTVKATVTDLIKVGFDSEQSYEVAIYLFCDNDLAPLINE